MVQWLWSSKCDNIYMADTYNYSIYVGLSSVLDTTQLYCIAAVSHSPAGHFCPLLPVITKTRLYQAVSDVISGIGLIGSVATASALGACSMDIPYVPALLEECLKYLFPL